jgi:hypothetical protein
VSDARPLRQLVADYLRSKAGERLSAADIARGLVDEAPQRFVEKERGLGSRTLLLDQLTREIYAQKKNILHSNPDLSIDTSRRPLRLFAESSGDTDAVAESLGIAPEHQKIKRKHAQEPSADVEEQNEHSLYRPLQQFLFGEMSIVSKRIRETTSSNRRGRNGNKWLHPDIVGMLAPGQRWTDVVRQCSMELPTRKAKLVAVEVKIRLTTGDVRESFFQTVSNSLWANRAYLAAVEIKGEDTMEELQTLCSLHGVGYVSIDPKQPAESRVVIPAREREEVDWASVNRIADENEDFRAYLADVLNFLKTGNIMPRLWEHTGSS